VSVKYHKGVWDCINIKSTLYFCTIYEVGEQAKHEATYTPFPSKIYRETM
jgi:hypothetical protein